MADETPTTTSPAPMPAIPSMGSGALPSGMPGPTTGQQLLEQARAERQEQQELGAALAEIPLRRSEDLGALFGALARAQGKIREAKKDATNPFFKSKYASLSAVWEACREALSENELGVTQLVRASGKAVVIITILGHSSGQYVEDRLVMIAKDDTPQGMGSAVTYGRRYALAAMVGVAPEDDDGAAATQGQAPSGVKHDQAKTVHQAQVGQQAAASLTPPTSTTAAPPPAQPLPNPPPVGLPRPIGVPVAPAPVLGAPTPATPSAPVVSAPPPPGMRPPMRAPNAPPAASTRSDDSNSQQK